MEEKTQDYHAKYVCPPKRMFEVGEPVEYGNNVNSVITGIIRGGLYYDVAVVQERRDGVSRFQSVVPWHHLYKIGHRDAVEREPSVALPDDLRFRCLSSTVGGLLNRIESGGVDFDPPYQRGHVWWRDEKERLIETIFNRGSIGTFAFNQRDFSFDGPIYEIVDGKQRLTTLNEFSQDVFPYKGKYFSQLNRQDRSLFDNTSAQTYDLENAGEIEVMKLFLRVNRAGTPVDEKHIDFVRGRLQELLAQKDATPLPGASPGISRQTKKPSKTL